VVIASISGAPLGLDATTGKSLWVNTRRGFLDYGRPQESVAASVVLTSHAVPAPPGSNAAGLGTTWEALSPKNGSVRWTKTSGYQCYPSAVVQ